MTGQSVMMIWDSAQQAVQVVCQLSTSTEPQAGPLFVSLNTGISTKSSMLLPVSLSCIAFHASKWTGVQV